MICLANVKLKQLDQLLKTMNSENTHWLSNVTWDVWKSYIAAKNIVADQNSVGK